MQIFGAGSAASTITGKRQHTRASVTPITTSNREYHVRTLTLPSLCCALALFGTATQAAPVRVDFSGTLSATNPGPLGASTPFSGSFLLDDTVVPTLATSAVYLNAIDDFVLTSGGREFRGDNGRLQIQLASSDFLSGTFNLGAATVEGSVPDGGDAYTLSNISFDFRLPAGTLPGLTPLPSGFDKTDFTFISLSLAFDHPTAGAIARNTILRGGSFNSLNFAPVPLPGALWLMASAGGLLSLVARRRARG